MDVINNPAEIEELINKHKVHLLFDIEKVSFEIRKYYAGETILESDRTEQLIVFLLEGESSIYSLKSDGGFIPVSVCGPGMMMGDPEFCGYYVPFHADADKDCITLVIKVDQNRRVLNEDIKFLRTLADSLAQKLAYDSNIELGAADIKERIMFYLENSDEHCISSVKKSTYYLHTSRRTLQRALRSLCESGKIERVKKGCYKLKE